MHVAELAKHPFWVFMASLRERHWAFWTLTLANLAGIIGGYYFYWDVGQFDSSSRFYQDWWLWPFVSDSPNAVVLMQISLTMWYVGRKRSRILDSFAFIHMVFVGLWTTYIFMSYPDSFGTYEFGSTNNILFVTHMGMPLEALILVGPLSKDRFGWGVAVGFVGWAALNLWLDYGPMGLRPAPGVAVADSFWLGSAGLFALTLAAWLLVARPMRSKPPG